MGNKFPTNGNGGRFASEHKGKKTDDTLHELFLLAFTIVARKIVPQQLRISGKKQTPTPPPKKKKKKKEVCKWSNHLVTSFFAKDSLTHSVCPLQVPILSVWQPDRHAVPDQRSVCSAAATSLHGYGGTPQWRPSLGKTHTQTRALLSSAPYSASQLTMVSCRTLSGERGPVGAEHAGILPALLLAVPQPAAPAPPRRARRRPQGLHQDEQRRRDRGQRVERDGEEFTCSEIKRALAPRGGPHVW